MDCLVDGKVDWNLVEEHLGKTEGIGKRDQPLDKLLLPSHLLLFPVGLDPLIHPIAFQYLSTLLGESLQEEEANILRFYKTRHPTASSMPQASPEPIRFTYNVFVDGENANPIFQRRDLNAWEETTFVCLRPTSSPVSRSGPSIVASKSQFLANLKAFVGLDITPILGPNIILGGSSMLFCLTAWKETQSIHELQMNLDCKTAAAEVLSDRAFGLPPEMQQKILDYLPTVKQEDIDLQRKNFLDLIAPTSDVDLFVVATSFEEAVHKQRAALNQLLDVLEERQVPSVIFKTPLSVTVSCGSPIRNIQFISLVVQDKEEILAWMDLAGNSIIFDGEEILCSPRAVQALNTWSLPVRKGSKQRIQKYFKLGFGMCGRSGHPQDLMKLKHLITEPSAIGFQLSEFYGASVPYRPTITLREIVIERSQSIRILDHNTHVDMSPADFQWMRSHGKGPNNKCLLCYQKPGYHDEFRALCSDCLPAFQRNNQLDPPLDGPIKLVFGGQNGPGFALALLLLRNGDNVFIATRSPVSLANALFQEEDHDDWKQNVIVLGIDLMDGDCLRRFVLILQELKMFSIIYYCACSCSERDFLAESDSESESKPSQGAQIIDLRTTTKERPDGHLEGRRNFALRRFCALNLYIPTLLQEAAGTFFTTAIPIVNEVKGWRKALWPLCLETLRLNAEKAPLPFFDANLRAWTICTYEVPLKTSPQETARQIEASGFQIT